MVYLNSTLKKRNITGFRKGKLRGIGGRKADAPILGWQVAEAPNEYISQENQPGIFFDIGEFFAFLTNSVEQPLGCE